MKIGGRRELLIPPALGYGDMGSGPVGPKETLIFVVDLIALK
jgi:peptidylprolyl isomerase